MKQRSGKATSGGPKLPTPWGVPRAVRGPPPRRVASTPRRRRGESAETSRGPAARKGLRVERALSIPQPLDGVYKLGRVRVDAPGEVGELLEIFLSAALGRAALRAIATQRARIDARIDAAAPAWPVGAAREWISSTPRLRRGQSARLEIGISSISRCRGIARDAIYPLHRRSLRGEDSNTAMAQSVEELGHAAARGLLLLGGRLGHFFAAPRSLRAARCRLGSDVETQPPG